MKRFLGFLILLLVPVLLAPGGCGTRPPIRPLPVPAPTVTPLPCGPSAFTPIGSIGCKQDGLAVLRSQADWTAYQALPGCGTSTSVLNAFDFSSRMVISYDYYACMAGAYCSGTITNVCFFADRIEVNITRTCGDAIYVDPLFDPNALIQCTGNAVSVPWSSLPVVPIYCFWSGMSPSPTPCP